MAKKKGKPKNLINMRKLTTWTTVVIFLFLAAVIGMTVWFVVNTLKAVGAPSNVDTSGTEDNVESIDARLLKTVSDRLDSKISQTVTPPGSFHNPFVRTAAPAPPQTPTPPTTAPPGGSGKAAGGDVAVPPTVAPPSP